MRWFPIVINSTFLLGTVALATDSPRANTDPVANRHVVACGPFGPVAERYVDRDKVCRRARQEALRSLRTGRDPDWGDVMRDSIPRASGRPGRTQNPERSRQAVKKYRTDPAQPNPSPTAGLIPSPSRTDVQPRPEPPAPTGPGIPGPPHHRPTPTTTARIVPDDHRPWLIPCTGAVALLALISGTISAARHRRAIVLATRPMLRHVKRNLRPIAHPKSTTTVGHTASDAQGIVPFIADGASITGPGAEDAVRHLALEILSRRQGDYVELVLTRSDAWRLFGTDIGTFQEDRVPGLYLTDDPEHTHAFLTRQSLTQQVLITYDSEAEEFRELLNHQQRRLAVVSLCPRIGATTEVSANGAVTRSNDALPSANTQLPLLSRADAFNKLVSMPTLARHGELGGIK